MNPPLDVGIPMSAWGEYSRTRDGRGLCPTSHPTFRFPLGDGRGNLLTKEVFVPGETLFQHVDRVGYISLFPLALRVVRPSRENVPVFRSFMRQVRELRSVGGLRSLARSDEYYERDNSEGDHAYWRGSVWINLNYLVIRALSEYATEPALEEIREEMGTLAREIASSVVENMSREYGEKGYIFEQYNAESGVGQRCHPFTGWSALVVLLMEDLEKVPS
jgi:mannosyl-oligosaccharide glucosidase